MFYEQKHILKAFSSLKEKFEKIDPSREALISLGENHLVSGKNLISWLRTDDQIENVVLDILELFSDKGEKLGVGSGPRIVQSIFLGKKSLSQKDLEQKLKSSRYPMKSDIENLIKDIYDEEYRDFLLRILDLSDFDGNIFLKRENVVKVILEKSDGYVFNLENPVKYEFDERNVKCFIIDGFVESVGEIHHILEDLSNKKIPGVIFARNFANDVLSTIKHNKITGRLNVLPIQVKFDFDDLNTLVDLAIISEGDVVSSDKGNLIKKINSDEIPFLERVSYKNEKLVIVNSKTSNKVKNHLLSLKRKSEDSDEVRRKMIERRLSSLSTNCLKISIPNGKKFDHIEIVLDSFLKLIKACMAYGVVEEDGKIIPSSTYISIQTFVRKFQKLIENNIAAAILLNQSQET